MKYNPDGSEADYRWNFDTPSCYQADSGANADGITTFTMSLKHNLTKIIGHNATVTSEGSVDYYICSDCHRLFLDASGSKEITQADTVIPKLTPGQQATNPAVSLEAYDKEIALKKGNSRIVILFVTGNDPAKAVTDKPSAKSTKAGIVKVSGLSLKGSKITLKVKGLKPGTSTVKVKSGNKTASLKITVVKKANPVKKLSSSKKKISMKKGKTTKLLIKITPKTKKYLCTDAVTATSSKKKVAAITSVSVRKGKAILELKGIAAGKSTITLKMGRKKTKITLNVL